MKRSGKVVGPSATGVAHRHGDQAAEQQEQQQEEEVRRKSSTEQPVQGRGAALPVQPTQRREGSDERSKDQRG